MCTDCKPAYMYRGERDIVMSVMMQQISMMPDFDISINTRLIKRYPVKFQITFNAFDYILSNILCWKSNTQFIGESLILILMSIK